MASMDKHHYLYYLLLYILFVTPKLTNGNCPTLFLLSNTQLTQEELITELTNPCRYDNIEKPTNSSPVHVQVDVNHLEQQDQIYFTAYMTVQYCYKDSRLAYKDIDPNREVLYGETFIRDRIWIPHLIISNGKDSNRLGVDKSDIFITIDPEGNVIVTQRISTMFYCWMDFLKFPFDAQTCSLTWRSWTSNTSHLLLYWDEDLPVRISSDLHLTEFILDKTRTFHRFVPGPFPKGPLSGNFSELVFEFCVRREIGYYMLCYFLPSILLVCTSWVAFWLQADAGPPRAILGTSTVVAFITLNVGLVKDLPKVSSIKASDIWSLAISIFIYASLAEFAFVNVIWRRKKQVEMVKADGKYILQGALAPSVARERFRKVSSTNSLHKASSFGSLSESVDCQPPQYVDFQEVKENGELVGSSSEEQTWHTMTPQEIAIWIDRKARIIFPVSFLVFNVFYWSFVYII